MSLLGFLAQDWAAEESQETLSCIHKDATGRWWRLQIASEKPEWVQRRVVLAFLGESTANNPDWTMTFDDKPDDRIILAIRRLTSAASV